MYGRAGFELLKLRILPLNEGSLELAHKLEEEPFAYGTKAINR